MSISFKKLIISLSILVLAGGFALAVNKYKTNSTRGNEPRLVFEEIRQWQIASDAVSMGATPTSSGNQAKTTGYSFNHTCDANTKALVVVVTGYESSDADAVVNSVTFNTTLSLTEAEYYRDIADGDDGYVSIWYLSNPPTGSSYAVAVTLADENTDSQATAVSLISATADTIVPDNSAEGTDTDTTHGLTISPAKTGSIAIAGIVNVDAAVTDISPTTGTLITGSEADMGNQTAECAYVAESSGTAVFSWSKVAANDSYAAAVTFCEQFVPTTVLNTPADTGEITDTTPTLEFTGTDPDDDDIEYNIQIDTKSTFIDFAALSQTSRNWTGISVDSSNQNVYAFVYNGDIYKQTGGGGDFAALSQTTRNWRGISVDSSNQNVYAIVDNGDIYKQTGGSGDFAALSQTSRSWYGISVDSSNQNVYAVVYGGDIYKQTGGGGDFAALSQTTRNWRGISVDSSNQNVYAIVYGGDIYKQTGGGGDFAALSQTTRNWYGISVDSSNQNVYAFVYNGDIYKQTGGSGDFAALSQTSRSWYGISVDSSNQNVYAVVYGGDIYKQTAVLLDKFSVTPDATFTNTTDGADDHPFDSGDKCDYTVQAGDALSVGTTYYWRVRAKDPTPGTDTYGDWSGTRSFTVISGSGITISGIAYTDEGTTPLASSDGTFKVVNNTTGATSSSAGGTDASGNWSITEVATPSVGDILTIWINEGTADGTLVVEYGATCTGYTDCTGLHLYQNRVIFRSENDNALANSDFANCDADSGTNCADAEIGFTSNSNALETSDGRKLIIWTGETLTAGGTVTTYPSSIPANTDGDLHIDGTGILNMEANALSVGGDFNNEGTMTFTSDQTTTFTATAVGHSITDGGENFENIIFNGDSGGWSFADSTIINKDLTMTAGTLSGTNDITVSGGAITGTNGSISLTGGTATLSGTGNLGPTGSGTYSFSNLTLSGITTAVGDFTVSSVLTISNTYSLDASDKTIILSGTGTPFIRVGTFTYSTSAVRYTGTGAATYITAMSGTGGTDGYYNLESKSAGATAHTFGTAASQTIAVNNDLTVGDGTNAGATNATYDAILDIAGNVNIAANATFTASGSAAFTVGGNWTNSGIFTHSSGTVTFDATTSGKTINAGSSSFNNVIFDGGGGEWSALTNTMTVANDLTMTTGTLNNSSGSADITVNGSVAGTAGIISLTTNTFEQRVAADENFGTTSGATAWTFNNLTFSNSNGAATPITITTQTGGSGGITVSGNLLVGKTGDTAGATTTLDAGNRIWTLSGTGGDPFQILASPVGDLTPATSTFIYMGNNGAGNTTVQSETYNILEINNGAEIYALEGTTGGTTVTITAGVLDTGANTLNVTGDLTMTGTLQGTGNVTINGNVTGAGTVNMTGGTFEQVIAVNKNFGSDSGANGWTFSNLKFNNSDGATAYTITPNAGTGTITVSGTLTLGDSGTQNITFDNETSNDRVFDIDGSILISTLGIFSASSTASFTLAGNFTDNKTSAGGFTPNSGTVTIDGAGTSTFDGANDPAIIFNNFTCATAGKTLSFTINKVFRINGKFTITGASGNEINIQSSSASTQWEIDHQGTEDITHAEIRDSGCETGTTNISLNNTSTEPNNNNSSCWLFPSLSFTLSTTSINLDLNAGNSYTINDTMTLTVTARSEFGYSLTAYETGLLTHPSSYTIPNYTDGGSASYANPTAWTVTCASDSNKCGFGYNTNDTDISQFQVNEFAPFSQTAPGDEVAKSTGPVTGEATTITYRSSVSAIQQAGQYQTTIIYIVTPEF